MQYCFHWDKQWANSEIWKDPRFKAHKQTWWIIWLVKIRIRLAYFLVRCATVPDKKVDSCILLWVFAVYPLNAWAYISQLGLLMSKTQYPCEIPISLWVPKEQHAQSSEGMHCKQLVSDKAWYLTKIRPFL